MEIQNPLFLISSAYCSILFSKRKYHASYFGKPDDTSERKRAWKNGHESTLHPLAKLIT